MIWRLVELYTSRWSSPLLRDADAQIIGISRGIPRWKLPYRYTLARWLAPSDETWAIVDPDQWRASYERQLEAIGVEEIIRRLEAMSGGRPCVLLCWEKVPERSCHRRYLAEWLEATNGTVVRELKRGDVPHRKDAAQPHLFE